MSKHFMREESRPASARRGERKPSASPKNKPSANRKVPSKNLRLDIQGLRALAVALVVVFHLRPSLLPGGYVGVDVFFVISGYLITGHMLREVDEHGSVRILEFWARRIRRLLPAALMVLLLSALAIIFLFPKTAWQQNLSEISFATVYVLNWRLAANSVDYLARDNQASIAQHYWSLSVEEQFYILCPLVIVAAVWLARRTGAISKRQAVGAVLALVIVASFAYSIALTESSQSAAYFVTTTRAWEFALGGLTALLPSPARAGAVRGFLSWGSVGAIAGTALLFDDTTSFPGWAAAFCVVPAAFLLWTGDSRTGWTPQRWSHGRLVQTIGDTSYAIYLWHWPLIIVFSEVRGGAPGWFGMVALSVAMLALAVATKHLVEDPVRRAPGFLRLRLPTFGLMAASMASLLALTIPPVHRVEREAKDLTRNVQDDATDRQGCFGANAIVNDCEDPYDRTPTVNPAAALNEELLSWPVPEGCVATAVADWSEFDCDFGGPGRKKTLLLIGDSHAWQFYPPLQSLAAEKGWRLRVNVRLACDPFYEASDSDPEANKRCGAFNQEVRQKIAADSSIDVVVVALRADREGKNAVARAKRAVKGIESSGKRVAVIRPVPGSKPGKSRQKGPDCVAAAGSANDPCTWRRPEKDWFTRMVRASKADLVDSNDLFCEDGRCHMVIGGTVVYSDDNHITLTFARSMVGWFDRKLTPIVDAAD